MILVTGATGFIGKPLVKLLINNGLATRTLLRPSNKTPDLPKGVSIDVAVASLTDEAGLRAAMRGVDTIIHLASAERQHRAASVLESDAQGTRLLADIASELKVKKFIYISHIGADRASYYPILKIKGLAEDAIRKSGVPYTILRSAVLYGPEDRFTTSIAKLLAFLPVTILPKNGENLLQPLFIDDLLTSILWSMNSADMENKTIEIAGAEFFTYKQVIELVSETIGIRRPMVSLSLSLFRFVYVFLDSLFPNLFLSSYWVDILSYNRTCPVDAVTRNFGFLPARFAYNLEYLSNKTWRK